MKNEKRTSIRFDVYQGDASIRMNKADLIPVAIEALEQAEYRTYDQLVILTDGDWLTLNQDDIDNNDIRSAKVILFKNENGAFHYYSKAWKQHYIDYNGLVKSYNIKNITYGLYYELMNFVVCIMGEDEIENAIDNIDNLLIANNLKNIDNYYDDSIIIK